MPQAQIDKAITQAKRLAEEDAAKQQHRDIKKVETLKEESDELLDEIDGLLEDQEILTSYRQLGGQ